MSDFRQLIVGPHNFIPALGGTTVTSFALDATNDAIAWAFQVSAQDTGTVVITRLGYRLTSVTGAQPVYKISLQGLDANGVPDGTIKGGGTPASATFTPAGSNTWNWVTLDNAYTASRGEFLAINIQYDSGTIGAGNTASFGQYATNGAVQTFPYSMSNNAAGGYVKQTIHPIFGYSSATRVYGTPVQQFTSLTVSSDTTPDEVALRFQIDGVKSYQVVGARMNGQAGAAAKSFKMILYDGTTVLQDVTIDSDFAVAAAVMRSWTYYFDEATLATLIGGQPYRISIQPQTTAITIGPNAVILTAAGDLDAYAGGQNWFYSHRTDAGAWTDVTTIRPFIELIIQDVTMNPPQVITATG